MLRIRSPKTVKEVQALNDKLAVLGCFLAKSVEKTFPFYKKLRRVLDKNTFRWTEEAENAFRQLKIALSKLPTLTPPIPGEVLTIYLTMSKTATNAILVAKTEDMLHAQTRMTETSTGG